MVSVNWLKIKNEYVNGGISYRALALKYGVNKDTIAIRAKAECWAKSRQTQTDNTHTKTIQKTAELISTKEANRIARTLTLADKLSDKLEQAISELDSHTVTSKRKTRTIEYKDAKALGKPSKEVIDEQEDIVIKQSLIDRRGLQQVATALKSINDVISVSNSPCINIADDGFIEALNNSALTTWGSDSEVQCSHSDNTSDIVGTENE